MRELEWCWDTADGMDKEEEGDSWFLGEAKGKHDWKAEKKRSNGHWIVSFF